MIVINFKEPPKWDHNIVVNNIHSETQITDFFRTPCSKSQKSQKNHKKSQKTIEKSQEITEKSQEITKKSQDFFKSKNLIQLFQVVICPSINSVLQMVGCWVLNLPPRHQHLRSSPVTSYYLDMQKTICHHKTLKGKDNVTQMLEGLNKNNLKGRILLVQMGTLVTMFGERLGTKNLAISCIKQY